MGGGYGECDKCGGCSCHTCSCKEEPINENKVLKNQIEYLEKYKLPNIKEEIKNLKKELKEKKRKLKVWTKLMISINIREQRLLQKN